MMERLTMWFGNNNDRCAMPNIEVCQIGQRHVWQQMMTEKLARYEDLEEQGLLVRLPCKVGDTVYCENEEYEIYQFYFRSENKTETPAIRFFAECMYNANCDDIDFWDYEIGKTVFLTREEAEAALREEQSK